MYETTFDVIIRIHDVIHSVEDCRSYCIPSIILLIISIIDDKGRLRNRGGENYSSILIDETIIKITLLVLGRGCTCRAFLLYMFNDKDTIFTKNIPKENMFDSFLDVLFWLDSFI